jgi:Na+/H+ antiporter NhaC
MTDITTAFDKTLSETRAAATDFRTLVANRIGYALIAGIVFAAIWLGHAL